MKTKIEDDDNNRSGVKYDAGKRDWTLLPWEPLEEVARVREFGVEHYGEDSWKDVRPSKRYLKAAVRHLIAYMKGEKVDPESGLNHLAHAACNCLFLIWFDQCPAEKNK